MAKKPPSSERGYGEEKKGELRLGQKNQVQDAKLMASLHSANKQHTASYSHHKLWAKLMVTNDVHQPLQQPSLTAEDGFEKQASLTVKGMGMKRGRTIPSRMGIRHKNV